MAPSELNKLCTLQTSNLLFFYPLPTICTYPLIGIMESPTYTSYLREKCLYWEGLYLEGLVFIFPHSAWIRNRKTPKTDTFYAVNISNSYFFYFYHSHWLTCLLNCICKLAIYETPPQASFFINKFILVSV